jgi:hypothetical protein
LRGLDEQDVAADGVHARPVHDARLRCCVRARRRLEARPAEQVALEVGAIDAARGTLPRRRLARDLAAQRRCDLALEVAHAGLARVARR